MKIYMEGESGQKKIEQIVRYFQLNHLATIANKNVEIIEDYDKQIRYVNNLEEKINLPKSLVVKYIFSDGGWFVFRPSGTEPKLKIYISIKGNTKEEARHAVGELKAALNKIIENI